MVEVVQNGKDKVYETQCKHCRSDLRYRTADLQTVTTKTEFFDRYADCKIRTVTTIETEYRAITCPVCGKEIVIETICFHRTVGIRAATKQEIKSRKISEARGE